MSELPSGTVSFVFTDIERSTALLDRLGDGYGEVLFAHRALLRGVWEAHGGIEVSTEGDAFFVAFCSASHAVAATAAGQAALAAHAWPHGEPVRVRTGVHTGEPRLRGASTGARTSTTPHGSRRPPAAAKYWSRRAPPRSPRGRR